MMKPGEWGFSWPCNICIIQTCLGPINHFLCPSQPPLLPHATVKVDTYRPKYPTLLASFWAPARASPAAVMEAGGSRRKRCGPHFAGPGLGRVPQDPWSLGVLSPWVQSSSLARLLEMGQGPRKEP